MRNNCIFTANKLLRYSGCMHRQLHSIPSLSCSLSHSYSTQLACVFCQMADNNRRPEMALRPMDRETAKPMYKLCVYAKGLQVNFLIAQRTHTYRRSCYPSIVKEPKFDVQNNNENFGKTWKGLCTSGIGIAAVIVSVFIITGDNALPCAARMLRVRIGSDNDNFGSSSSSNSSDPKPDSQYPNHSHSAERWPERERTESILSNALR